MGEKLTVCLPMDLKTLARLPRLPEVQDNGIAYSLDRSHEFKILKISSARTLAPTSPAAVT